MRWPSIRSAPDVNREHVFERMKAERARIAKENRSAGELEAKKVIAAFINNRTIYSAADERIARSLDEGAVPRSVSRIE
jgi:hypothetical protein